MLCKAPNEVFDYVVDWTADLLPSDTISTSEWTVEAGITKDADSILAGLLTTDIDLSGGVAGTNYELINKIVTTGGKTFERRLYIMVQERLVS